TSTRLTRARARIARGVKDAPRLSDRCKIRPRPVGDGNQWRPQGMPELGELVVHSWRNRRVHGAGHEAIALQTPQGQSQHALGDTFDVAADLIEPHRTARTAQLLYDQHRPLIPYTRQCLTDQAAFGLRLRLARVGLVFVTRFQISAFLQVSATVTIVALVTIRNQAT